MCCRRHEGTGEGERKDRPRDRRISGPGLIFGGVERYAFCIYPVDSEEYIPYCNQQPPNQDETANHSTNNKVQQEQRKGGSQRAARYDPGEHPWDAKRQTAKYEQPYIVGDTIFCASGFENAVQQSRHRHGQHTLFEKLFDYFGFRHSQHLHSWFHYISRITMRPGVLQRL